MFIIYVLIIIVILWFMWQAKLDTFDTKCLPFGLAGTYASSDIISIFVSSVPKKDDSIAKINKNTENTIKTLYYTYLDKNEMKYKFIKKDEIEPVTLANGIIIYKLNNDFIRKMHSIANNDNATQIYYLKNNKFETSRIIGPCTK